MDDQSLGNGNPFIFSNGDGLGSPIMTLKSGNVGIGTTSPSNKLEVVGGIRTSSVDVSSLNPGSTTSAGQIQGGVNAHLVLDLLNNGASDAIAFRYSAANNTVVDSIGLVMKGDGKVGIGTTIPDSRLHVYSSRSDSPSDMYNIRSIFDISGVPTTVRAFDMRVNNNATSGTITNLQGQYTEMNITNNASVTEVKNYTTWGTKQGTGTVSNWMLFDASNPNKTAGAITNLYGLKIADLTAGTNNWSIYTGTAPSYFGGSVGIGTTSPGQKLDVAGHINMSGATSRTIFYGATGAAAPGAGSAGEKIQLYGTAGTVGANDYALGIESSNMWFNTASGFKWYVQSAVKAVMNSSGNVGIGTTNPQNKLQVKGRITIENDSGGTLKLGRCDNTHEGGQIDWVPAGSYTTWMQDLYDSSMRFVSNSSADNKIEIFNSHGTGKAGLYVEGNVGIGASNPNSKLEVDGGFLQIYDLGSNPVSTDCDASNEYGRMYVETGTNRGLMVCLDNGWYTIRPGSNDLAENFPTKDKFLGIGDIVSIDEQYSVFVRKAENAQLAIGVVSTRPGYLLGENIQDLYPSENFVPVALAGRVPVKVIKNQNEAIKAGDLITISSYPGIGALANKAGPVIGKALENNSYWNEQTCPFAPSVEEIIWPEDDGSNFAKPCFRLPDNTYIGKIMVFINLSWYDPDVYLTSTGELQITQADTKENTNQGEKETEIQNAKIKMQNENAKFKVIKSQTGETIEKIIAGADGVFARVKAGAIEATNLLADNLIAKKITSEEKIISPVVETEQLKVKSEKLKVSDQNGQSIAEFDTESKKTTLFGDLEVAGNTKSQEVSAQKASFGDLLAENVGIGQMEAEKISTDTLAVNNDATISGTLYVDRVVAREGGFGELLAQNLSVEGVRSITGSNGIEEQQEHGIKQDDGTGEVQDYSLAQVQDNNESGAQDNSVAKNEEELDLEALLTQVKEWAGTSAKNDLPLECTGSSGMKQDSKSFCLVDTNFTVLGGRTSLGDTSIAGQLSIGSLTIADNSLDALGSTLYLQKMAMGGLDILNGKITVGIDGNVFIAAHLTVGGGIATNEIKPTEGGDLTFNLDNAGLNGMEDKVSTQEETGLENAGFGKLLVKGINNETVASIDASGSAEFKKIRTDLLQINTDNEASESGEIIIAAADNSTRIGISAPGVQTNATAGEATLPAGETKLIIYSNKLTNSSMVYLTPTSDTKNQVLYVKKKEGSTNQTDGATNETNSGYFVVGINEALSEPVRFNWWIIN